MFNEIAMKNFMGICNGAEFVSITKMYLGKGGIKLIPVDGVVYEDSNGIESSSFLVDLKGSTESLMNMTLVKMGSFIDQKGFNSDYGVLAYFTYDKMKKVNLIHISCVDEKGNIMDMVNVMKYNTMKVVEYDDGSHDVSFSMDDGSSKKSSVTYSWKCATPPENK